MDVLTEDCSSEVASGIAALELTVHTRVRFANTVHTASAILTV